MNENKIIFGSIYDITQLLGFQSQTNQDPPRVQFLVVFLEKNQPGWCSRVSFFLEHQPGLCSSEHHSTHVINTIHSPLHTKGVPVCNSICDNNLTFWLSGLRIEWWKQNWSTKVRILLIKMMLGVAENERARRAPEILLLQNCTKCYNSPSEDRPTLACLGLMYCVWLPMIIHQ